MQTLYQAIGHRQRTWEDERATAAKSNDSDQDHTSREASWLFIQNNFLYYHNIL